MARVVLGVTGGIAAYKAVVLIRLLQRAGHTVRVVPTAAALEFVGAATFEAITGRPAHAGVFDDAARVDHIDIARSADLVVVAPATADLLAKAACGLAGDLLTSVLLATQAPILVAPAMHSAMLAHPATQANLATLRARGVIVLDSPAGSLTSGDTGPGRMAEPETIAAAVEQVLRGGQQDLAGVHAVISAGGTREALDPVRYLGNRSSGKQGFALAQAALARGAQVSLVAANVDLPTPAGAERVDVVSALELREAMLRLAARADVVIMAAAVADFRPAQVAATKIKRGAAGEGLVVELVPNPDVLRELVAAKGETPQVVVGFAAETGDGARPALEYARDKARDKGADLTVANVVAGGAVFGHDTNDVMVLDASGATVAQAAGPKLAVADAVWDAIAPLLAAHA
ncbi:MAG: bifunctional phosphopantothenoylcysteine decarboxylase/phosphopantothenate--cysteine ligase CoaBC [Bifidobacteriaceae bacterium]|jgi:phosphopantothenoylcysteine decarboxylase/phosphopantothenate--cysteine ligase|nr:bifunctional phosphopantothenoylcysteine decarboxylase/phosphopantothenate--cysteine ligase CoaBC [Bifidobacteriaceae bacterium]